MAADAARLQAERLFAAHRLTDAVRHARKALELAGLDERMLRRLLALIADAGDRSTAVATYEEFATLLREEYGAEPSPELAYAGTLDSGLVDRAEQRAAVDHDLRPGHEARRG